MVGGVQESLAAVVDSLVRHAVAAHAASPHRESIIGWGTLALAAWGGVLSTILGWKTFIADRRRLRVTCSVAFTSPPVGGTWKFLLVEAVNVGKRPVEIKSAGILLCDGGTFIQRSSRVGPQPFGRRLSDGESASFFFDWDALRSFVASHGPDESLKRAIVTDAEGRRHSAKLGKGIKRALTESSDTPSS